MERREYMERRTGSLCGVRNALDQHKVFFNQTGQHTHPSNLELTAVEKIWTNMKGMAEILI